MQWIESSDSESPLMITYHYFIKLLPILDGILCVCRGGRDVCMACVPRMMFWKSKKVLYIEIEIFFKTSITTDHDQSSICMLGGLALVLRDSAWLVVYLTSLLARAIWTALGFTDKWCYFWSYASFVTCLFSYWM